MKFFSMILLVFGCGLMAQEAPVSSEEETSDVVEGLPEWSDEELAALEAGEFVPGSSLMGKLARAILDSDKQEVIELDPKIRDLPEEVPKPDVLTNEIPEEFRSDYFNSAMGPFLNDPQELLSSQEFRDREGFLDFHATDCDINCYLYLFDGPQEIPEGESLERLVATRFDNEQPLAVVFYFLGDPGRSQLVFSKKVVDVVSQKDRESILTVAIEEAFEKSDPTSQLESFLMQLSIRLQRLVSDGGGFLFGGKALVMPDVIPRVEEGPGLWERLVVNQGLFYTLLGLAVVVPAVLLGLLGRWIAGRNRTYYFPDAEGAPLLEAPHAAGVGGVLSFSSATVPPSNQKQDVPDYLQKM